MVPASLEGTLTQAGSSIGTPAYMEYELLGGAHPFAGKTGPSPLIAAHLAELPAPLATRVPELACAKAALVMQCLTKIPSERSANAYALLERLASVSVPSAERANIRVPASRRGAVMVAGVAVLEVVACGLWVARIDASAAFGIRATTPNPSGRRSGTSDLSDMPMTIAGTFDAPDIGRAAPPADDPGFGQVVAQLPRGRLFNSDGTLRTRPLRPVAPSGQPRHYASLLIPDPVEL